MSKPRIAKGPASAYAGRDESIYEFSVGGYGGLISIRTLADGTPVIDLYRVDPAVQVRTSYEETTEDGTQ